MKTKLTYSKVLPCSQKQHPITRSNTISSHVKIENTFLLKLLFAEWRKTRKKTKRQTKITVSLNKVLNTKRKSTTYRKPMSECVHNRKTFGQILSNTVGGMDVFNMFSEFLRARCQFKPTSNMIMDFQTCVTFSRTWLNHVFFHCFKIKEHQHKIRNVSQFTFNKIKISTLGLFQQWKQIVNMVWFQQRIKECQSSAESALLFQTLFIFI